MNSSTAQTPSSSMKKGNSRFVFTERNCREISISLVWAEEKVSGCSLKARTSLRNRAGSLSCASKTRSGKQRLQRSLCMEVERAQKTLKRASEKLRAASEKLRKLFRQAAPLSRKS